MLPEPAMAQRSPDTAFTNTLSVFTQALNDQAAIYNGIQYRRYPEAIHEGHPFFLADSLIAGTVTYEGLTYNKVRLLYDEVNDELITTDWQANNLVQLFEEKVDGFTIATQKFVRIAAGNPPSGYCRLIYDGASRIVAKERKTIQVRTGRTSAETQRWVSSSTDYYLETPQGFRKFHRLNAFLSLLGRHRKQVENYIKQNRLHCRSEKDRVLAEAARYYDQLNMK